MKRKVTTRRKTAARKRATRPRKAAATGQIVTGNLALHDLFQQQAAAILDEADIGEEEKQSILLAMSCPCCGAGGMSYSVKMKPKAPKRFVADET
jgi:hypothetical protein